MEVLFKKQAVLTYEDLKTIVIDYFRKEKNINIAFKMEIVNEDSYGGDGYEDVNNYAPRILIEELP